MPNFRLPPKLWKNPVRICGARSYKLPNAIPTPVVSSVFGNTDDPNGVWALDGTNPGRNLDHFAIATDHWDERRMRNYLAEQRIEIVEERAEEAELSFYIRDPSGNLVELLRRSS